MFQPTISKHTFVFSFFINFLLYCVLCRKGIPCFFHNLVTRMNPAPCDSHDRLIRPSISATPLGKEDNRDTVVDPIIQLREGFRVWSFPLNQAQYCHTQKRTKSMGLRIVIYDRVFNMESIETDRIGNSTKLCGTTPSHLSLWPTLTSPYHDNQGLCSFD